MNQTELSKHLDKTVPSITHAMKKLAFREGREFSYENKGQPGKERKIFSLMGIRRLEKRFVLPKEKWYRPAGTDDGYWVVDSLPTNKRIIYLKHSQTGERATCRVNKEKQKKFKKGRRIWEKAITETTPKRSLAGSIWTGLPRPAARRFDHKNAYPRNRGYYGKQLENGEMV